ncbi:host-nuclease inhibitor protein Gam [Salmonella enterica subsp. enterica]|nr:host-nuclease inhibitor protein Gam [Salmonella enterica subsp. enterica]
MTQQTQPLAIAVKRAVRHDLTVRFRDKSYSLRGIPTRIETDANDQIAVIMNQNTPKIEALRAELDVLQKGVQTWCEANRSSITKGDSKTANLITGEVAWRKKPDSVNLKGVEIVIETLKKLKLDRFIRRKEEVNKDAILADREAVKGITGISIASGKETFSITPFEQEIEK